MCVFAGRTPVIFEWNNILAELIWKIEQCDTVLAMYATHEKNSRKRTARLT